MEGDMLAGSALCEHLPEQMTEIMEVCPLHLSFHFISHVRENKQYWIWPYLSKDLVIILL